MKRGRIIISLVVLVSIIVAIQLVFAVQIQVNQYRIEEITNNLVSMKGISPINPPWYSFGGSGGTSVDTLNHICLYSNYTTSLVNSGKLMNSASYVSLGPGAETGAFFASCGDDNVFYWSGGWQWINSCSANAFLKLNPPEEYIVCEVSYSDRCAPTSCSGLILDCGSWADGCKGTLNCGGTCPTTCVSSTNVVLGKTVVTSPNPAGQNPALITNGAYDGIWNAMQAGYVTVNIDLGGSFDISKYSLSCIGGYGGNFGFVYLKNSAGTVLSYSGYSCDNSRSIISKSFTSPVVGVSKVEIAITGGADYRNLQEFQAFESACKGKVCGSDGCGGSCGGCSSGYTCNGAGQCVLSCSNACTSGQKRCNANNVETCSDYNSDSCTEWGVSTTCLSGRTCNPSTFVCDLGLISSYASSIALLNSQYSVKCDFGVSGLSCVSAGASCISQGYQGTNATFSCTASPLGSQVNYCNLINDLGVQGCSAKTNSITTTNVIECSTDSDCTGKGSCSRCDLLTNTCVPKSSGTVCRASAGVCDATETCSGSSMSCPGDLRVSAGTVCRAASGNCDLSETCDGSSINCPSDLKQPNGLTCTGINKCYPYTCQSGTCTQGGTQINCNDGRSCTIDDCDPGIGCVYDNSNCQCTTAAQCDDTNPCTVDSCLEEVCQHTPGNSGAICRASVGPCDISEYCNGLSSNCPVQTFNSSMTICRAASGVCDATERCSGTGPDCPIDTVFSSGTVCRAFYHECDSPETCNGISKSCPIDSNLSDSSSCSSDNCTSNRACTHGVCSGGTPILPKPSGCSCKGSNISTCDEAGSCQEVACITGNCIYTPTNVFIDDGDKCKSNRQCIAGSFTFDVKDCVSTNECQNIICNSLTGNCDKTNKPNGTACLDSYCYSNRTCSAGICMGGNSKTPVPVGCGISSLSVKASSLDFFTLINIIEVIIILGIFYFVYRLHKNKNKKKGRKKK